MSRREQLGRGVSMVLYGLLCAMLGALGYRRGLEPHVRAVAEVRRAGSRQEWPELADRVDQLVEAWERGAR